MSDSATQFYPLFGLSADKLETTLRALEGYWKTRSIVYLNLLGLPTLKAVAITGWNDSIKKDLTRFLTEKSWTSVVIRTDKKIETGTAIPLGGYVVTLENLDTEVQKYIAQGRIVMLLEPRNRYKNMYGINVLYDNNSPDIFQLEVVGPGFDVSDLNRGDVTPHEQISLERKQTDRLLIKRSTISHSEYKKSIFKRLVKIGKINLTTNTIIPDTDTELADIGRQFLMRNGYDLLFRYEEYPPLPNNYLKRILDLTSILPEKMSNIGLDTHLFVVSATIFEEAEELVFWDIVWARHKYKGVSYGS